MTAKWNKSNLNIVIDITLMILMMAIAGLGLMMKYVLVAGFKAAEIYGKHVELTFLNLDRHEWGAIHLLLSYIMLGFLALHIILHWKQVVGMYTRLLPNKLYRVGLAYFLTFLGIVLLLGSLFIRPQVSTKENHLMQQNSRIERDEIIEETNQHQESHNEINGTKHHETNVSGKMTLREVAESNSLPLDVFLVHLGIPKEDADVRLGQLKRRYNFEMEEVRLLIEKNKK